MPIPWLQKHFALTSFQRGLWLLAIGTFMFSGKGILIKLAYEYDVSPTVLMSIRMLISLPFYIWVLLQQLRAGQARDLSHKQWLQVAGIGLLGYYIASWLDLTGLVYLPASIERIVLYSYPSLVLLFSVVFLQQRLSAALLVSLVLIYAGLSLVFIPDILALQASGGEQEYALGVALVFASAVSFALFFVGSEVMLRHMSSKLFTAGAMIAASLAIIVHYLLSHDFSVIFQQAPEVYGYGFAIAFFCTVIPSFFVSAGIQRVGAATGSMVGAISPILTLILAFSFLGESISGLQSAGFLVVIAAVFNLGRLKKATA